MCEKWVITCLFICYSKYAFPGGKKNPIHSFQILQVNTVSSSQTHAAFWCLSTVPTTFRVRSFDSIHVVLLIDGFIAWADGVTKKQMSKKLSGMPDPEPLTDEVGGGLIWGSKWDYRCSRVLLQTQTLLVSPLQTPDLKDPDLGIIVMIKTQLLRVTACLWLTPRNYSVIAPKTMSSRL